MGTLNAINVGNLGILLESAKMSVKPNATVVTNKAIWLEIAHKEIQRKQWNAINVMKLVISLVIAKVTLQLFSMIYQFCPFIHILISYQS